MVRFFSLFLLFALSACASPLPEEARFPHFTDPIGDKEISIAIVDHRTFILNGDKEPWFEGIFRGEFGIPFSHARPVPDTAQGTDKTQPFALYLSKMIKEAVEEAGAKGEIIEIAAGTNLEETRNILATEKNPALLGIMRHSRFDSGFSADYRYDFQFVVLDSENNILADKTFAAWDETIPLSDKYNLFDMFTEIYSQKLTLMLNDPEISNALKNLQISLTDG
ncbi:hypothetical protein NBZ79_09945 [Sneathiella marina]|uniref:Lipoprotein n=1 Tax=Sneathiella marina TaxID=2950108 RepID=A0ABY4VX52_9PROT|nr:hypothetical protein [Sneathiella marina]USG59510.1 hypothetical protein NBZ79_09945 [Sneathiella marina]